MTTTPRIYVACLAAYNNGHLHGAWIDATQGEWAIWTDIQTILAASPIAGAEEWAIHDYEGFYGASVSEHASVETVVRLAGFISEHGELGATVLEHYGGDVEEAEEALKDRYLGCWAAVADYIQECHEQANPVPEALRFYIDWQSMARDAQLGGELVSFEVGHGQVHLFAGC
jgi:antirestriction protein